MANPGFTHIVVYVVLPLDVFALLSGTAAASEFSDYQSGFRCCLANVNQYLLMADNLNGSDRWMLSQLSSKLCRSRGREEAFSTMDSAPDRADAQEEVRRILPPAAGPEQRKTAKSKTLKEQSASTSSLLPNGDAGAKQAVPAAAPKLNTPEQSSMNKKIHAASHRNEVANTQHNVWRPW